MKKKQSAKKQIRMPVCNMPKMNGCGGAFYGLGFIGALVYYLTTATSVWMGFLGILKALVWPAFLVFELMKFLGM